MNQIFAENFSCLTHEEPKKTARIPQTRVKVIYVFFINFFLNNFSRNLRALNAERRDERRTEKRERRERRGGTSVKRQRRLAEEGPALIEMTKKILSMDTLKPEQEIDLETLENELRENNTGGRSRLTAVMTIFRGFRIVRKVFMAF